MASLAHLHTPPGASPTGAPRLGAAPPARSPLNPATSMLAARGSMQVARAAAMTYREDWEVYQAECTFHQLHVQRTLEIMQQLGKEFRDEWQTYNAEAALAAGSPQLQRSGDGSGSMQRRRQVAQATAVGETSAGATPIVGDIFDDAMRPGGYHPVAVGERFNDGRYTALYKLGQGHYATVWMVLEGRTGQQLAMKVVRSAEAYTAAARTEVALLNHILGSAPSQQQWGGAAEQQQGAASGAQHCVRLLDSFEHTGPHGTHICEVFESLGDDLLTLIKEYNFRGVPLSVVRHLARQTLSALDYLHADCQVIHTDLKPENVMLTEPIRPRGFTFSNASTELDLPALEPRLLRMGAKVVDFGCATWSDRRVSDDVQTRQYRAPEVILGAGYDDAADMWSLACMVFELVTGDLLFHPEARPGEWNEDEDHLAQMMEALQPMPQHVATRGKHSARFFTPEGRLCSTARRLHPMPLDWVLHEKYQLPAEEALALRDFLMPMLAFDPAKRASAAEMLQHPWLHQQ